jgi:hypothetical protein
MCHLPTFEELRHYVHKVLCDRADLDPVTPMLECTVERRGEPVGIEYTLIAPRSIRLSAIWDSQGERIFFYDHDLDRFQVTPVQGPDKNGIRTRPREAIRVKSLWKGK